MIDDLLGLVFGGLAILFTIWIVLTLSRYLRFRKIAPDSLLSWEVPRPWFFNLCMGIGFFMVVLTAVNLFLLDRPWLHALSQGLMAIFYVIVFPLSFRIRRGFYETGIWAEQGFLPYQSIRWIGWKEAPELVLALRTEGRFSGQSYAFLRVPSSYYGQARRILGDRIKDQSLSLQGSLLGLAPEVTSQEQI